MMENKRLYCETCDYLTSNKSNLTRHNRSKRHLCAIAEMINTNCPNSSNAPIECIKIELECIRREFDRYREEKEAEIKRLTEIILKFQTQTSQPAKKPKCADIVPLTDEIIRSHTEEINPELLSPMLDESMFAYASKLQVTQPIDVCKFVDWLLSWLNPYMNVTDKARMKFLWIDADANNVKEHDIKGIKFLKKLFDTIDYKFEEHLTVMIEEQKSQSKKAIRGDKFNKRDTAEAVIQVFYNTLDMSRKLAEGKQNKLGEDIVKALTAKLSSK